MQHSADTAQFNGIQMQMHLANECISCERNGCVEISSLVANDTTTKIAPIFTLARPHTTPLKTDYKVL